MRLLDVFLALFFVFWGNPPLFSSRSHWLGLDVVQVALNSGHPREPLVSTLVWRRPGPRREKHSGSSGGGKEKRFGAVLLSGRRNRRSQV